MAYKEVLIIHKFLCYFVILLIHYSDQISLRVSYVDPRIEADQLNYCAIFGAIWNNYNFLIYFSITYYFLLYNYKILVLSSSY